MLLENKHDFPIQLFDFFFFLFLFIHIQSITSGVIRLPLYLYTVDLRSNVDTPHFSLKSNDSFAHQYSRGRVQFQITQVQKYHKI